MNEIYYVIVILFFKQKTAYEMRISDCSSDVCSSDLGVNVVVTSFVGKDSKDFRDLMKEAGDAGLIIVAPIANVVSKDMQYPAAYPEAISVAAFNNGMPVRKDPEVAQGVQLGTDGSRSEERRVGKEWVSQCRSSWSP